MGSWLTKSNMNKGRWYHGLAGTTLAGLAFASGVTNNKNTSETFDGTSWTNAANLNGGDNERCSGAGTQTAGLMAGGLNASGNPVVRTEEFNGTNWVVGGDMIAARSDLGLTGTQVAALSSGGGATGGTPVTKVETYNGTNWANGANLPAAIDFHALAGTQTSALNVAGYNSVMKADVYSFNGTDWTAKAAVSIARYQLGSAGANNANVLVFGGHDGSVFKKTTENFNGTSWAVEADLPIANTPWDGAGTSSDALCCGGQQANRACYVFTPNTIIEASPLTGMFTLPDPNVFVLALVLPSPLAGTFTLNDPLVQQVVIYADPVTGSFTVLDPQIFFPITILVSSLSGEFAIVNPLVQTVVVLADPITGAFVIPAHQANPIIVYPDPVTGTFSIPDPDALGKTVLIGVSGFPNGKTVSFKVVDEDGAMLQDWTNVGVIETVIDATAGRSVYHAKTPIIGQDFQGVVLWKTNDNPPLTASEPFNVYQSYMINVRSKTNIIPQIDDRVQVLPTLSEIEASTVLAKEATLSRLLGLALENHVEDDIVRDVSGNKTSSALYCYDSAAAVGTHVSGGGPGLVAKYNVTAAYSNGKMTSFKVVKA